MICIIAGSRDIRESMPVLIAIEESGFPISRVVSGCAAGVDTIGDKWATARNIPVDRFPANWEKHGKAAGPIRNAEMAKHVAYYIEEHGVRGGLIAVMKHGGSRGTEDMIRQAEKLGLEAYVKEL